MLFGIALAKLGDEGPEPYLDSLCRAAKISIMDHVTFANWWGGQHPSGQAWEILLAYANTKTAAEINAPEFQPVIEALEYSIAYDPNKQDDKRTESSDNWVSMAGSHVVEGIYKLYVSKGLTKRANKFRILCEKRLTFDSSVYFEQVDRAHR